MPKWPKANSKTLRRVTLTNARLTQHYASHCIFTNISFRPHYLPLASVPFSLWDQQRVTLRPEFQGMQFEASIIGLANFAWVKIT